MNRFNAARLAVAMSVVIAIFSATESPVTAGTKAAGNPPVGTPVSAAEATGTNAWEVPVPAAKPKKGEAAPNYSAGVCRGTLTQPILNAASVQYGAVQSCTSSVYQSIRVTIQICYRGGGGADDFYCGRDAVVSPVVYRTAHQIRADVYLGCQRGVPGRYRAVARVISVKNVSYPDVYGGIQPVDCG